MLRTATPTSSGTPSRTSSRTPCKPLGTGGVLTITLARKAFFTTRTTGTGLGLAIVHRILTAHRGAVDIESSRGEGTAVRRFVPEPPPPAA